MKRLNISTAAALAAVVLLSGAAFAQSGSANGAAAVKMIAGNTLIGKATDGEELVQFYAADGTIKVKVEQELDEGKWTVQKDKLCHDFPDDDEDVACFDVSVSAGTVTLTDEAGGKQQFKLVSGNPNKL